jgi:uncharacterized repeat protein (TIGR03843 family)
MNSLLIHSARTLEDPITLSYEQALALVQRGAFATTHGIMGYGTNYTFLVTLCLDDLEALAIYKPCRGERPLWDFPDGTLYQREVAAFVVSEALGWYIVPPTAIREGEHGPGSVQIFIHHDPERHYYNFDEQHLEQIKRVCLFDILINNADRKGGHLLLDSAERVWGIDHGLGFHVEPKLRTVIWDFVGQPIDPDYLACIERFAQALEADDSPLRQQLDELLDVNEVLMLSKRTRRLLKSGYYPLPGRGPNRPWPAI